MPEYLSPGVYVQEVSPLAPAIEGAPTSVAAFIGRTSKGPVNEPTRVAGFSDFERTFGGLWAESALGFAVQDFFANGGHEAVVVRIERADGGPLTREDFTGPDAVTHRRGLYALDDFETVNLLCIPPYRADGSVEPALLTEAAEYCARRRAILLVDPPVGWGVQEARDFRASLGLSGDNAAFYFPRIRRRNPLTGAVEAFAPSGAVAGVIARTDATRGAWKAPAGMEASLRGVTALDLTLTDAQSGLLNTLGVNCLRTLANVGHVVWGARTIAGADALGSDWKYLPVRRTALYIRESLERGLQWTTFEPNQEALWVRVRAAAQAFLTGLLHQGGLRGGASDEAFFVRCDATTMTSDDLDNGRLIVLVGAALLRPAEFVTFRLELRTADSTF